MVIENQKSPEEMTPEELKAHIEQQQDQPPESTPAPPPQEFKISLEDGSTYVGNSWEDVANKVAKAKMEASKTIRSREEEMAGLRQELASKKEPEPEPPAEFDREKYWKMWEEDPLAAQQYMNSCDPNYQRIASISEESDEAHQVARFNAHMFRQEKYLSPEDSQPIIKYFQDNNLRFNASKAVEVMNDLVASGKIKISELKDAPPERTTQPPQPPPGPPEGEEQTPPGGEDMIEKARTMSLDELKDFINTEGMKQQ